VSLKSPKRQTSLTLVLIAGLVAQPTLASADTPLSYLTSSGPKADWTLNLTWGLLLISIFVVVLFSALVVWAIFRKRTPAETDAPGESAPVSGFNVFGWGLIATTLILVGSVGWTMVTLAAINNPPRQLGATIEVTGKQWWWQVNYIDAEASKNFSTANEIHIPVGEPVAIKLRSDDVIHSFWVPALAGKTDVIPGQINTTWFEASTPGTFLGACTEYCGLQHAHMAIRVVAEPRDKFESWRDNQLRSGEPAQNSGDAKTGLAVFERRCGVCHTVRGTPAGGVFGPDLSHLMTRATLAAGAVPNDEGDLAGWIADPQQIKPGTRMPQVQLSGDEMQSITTFLTSLK
jgi:cytochrome c oxidase subunit II